jgi:hypothetical protein
MLFTACLLLLAAACCCLLLLAADCCCLLLLAAVCLSRSALSLFHWHPKADKECPHAVDYATA